MQTYQGKTICKGIAAAPLKFFSKKTYAINRTSISDPKAEIVRFHDARNQAMREMRDLYDKALSEVGRSGSAVFDSYQILLSDEEYIDSVCNAIRSENMNAEYAVYETSRSLVKLFSSVRDEYIRARADDIKDISLRLIELLSGRKPSAQTAQFPTEPSIVYAEDISPADLVQMDRSMLLGLVCLKGSSHSHTAIFARNIGIPAMTGIALSDSDEGSEALLDGYDSLLYIRPDGELLHHLLQKREEMSAAKQRLSELKGKETVTLDGRHIDLFANVSSIDGVALATANDAEGIGLLRTEFLYLESEDYPTEEMQLEAYRSVLEKMGDRRVIIRTLDIGADKQKDYLKLDPEANPAMGLRGIRLCLDRPQMFKTQLRALYRASVCGNLAIMFPMITSVEEVSQIKEIIVAVKVELANEGLPYKEIPVGIMIETPAAAMISDLLAKEVDFFSIGSNDLTQYTLAIDRQNLRLDRFYDPHHEAILRMIRMVVDNAHKEGCRVGICGELGSDPTLTEAFLGMGIDELSVSPSMILPLRGAIRGMDLSEAKSLI